MLYLSHVGGVVCYNQHHHRISLLGFYGPLLMTDGLQKIVKNKCEESFKTSISLAD